LEGLGINLGYLLVQIFNFLIVLVILRAWVYKPLLQMLERRRKTVAQSLEDARVAAEARANAEREAQAIIAQAQQEAAQRIREATERAEQVGREIKASAEAEAAELRQAGAAEAEQAKVQALGELRGQVGALAVAAAQKLIGETLDGARQRHLIAEFFSGVRGGKVLLLEGADVGGREAEITSALPLTDQEQSAVRTELLSKLGGAAEVRFRVDPSILGGLVVRVGDRVLDGSVAGKLEGLRQSLR
jgi:F-type H+-transporting ATPase subunit b